MVFLGRALPGEKSSSQHCGRNEKKKYIKRGLKRNASRERERERERERRKEEKRNGVIAVMGK